MKPQERIEKHIIIEETLEIKEQDEFIVYEDTNGGEDYNPVERAFENDVLLIRLYCMHEGCNKYILGLEGYNGGFISENGAYADLRNQGFSCKEHK